MGKLGKTSRPLVALVSHHQKHNFHTTDQLYELFLLCSLVILAPEGVLLVLKLFLLESKWLLTPELYPVVPRRSLLAIVFKPSAP